MAARLGLIAAGMAWAEAASAAPRFTGDPQDVALATEAWRAAVACTGRAGASRDEVPIVRRVLPGAYLGVARTDPASGILERIDLAAGPDRIREVVVHEVTHAWVSDGPVALVEGVAELIADCVSREVRQASPGGSGLEVPRPYDDGRSLPALPDLLRWTGPVEGVPSELYAVRTDGYVGAARLIRTAALAVPAETLWAGRTVRWDDLRGALAGAGSRGEALLAVIDGGAGAQAAALADEDRDGVTTIAEGWLGTDPNVYDTDGDGWWDGAPTSDAGVVVPLDGVPVCAGEAVDGERISLPLGGTVRGIDRTPLVARRLDGPGPRAIVVHLDGVGAEVTEGVWLAAPVGPVPPLSGASPGCAAADGVTAWAEDPRYDVVVGEVARRVREAADVADQAFGRGPERYAVALGGSRTDTDGRTVTLSGAEVDRILATGGAAELARIVVAVRRLWTEGERDWSAAEAFARALAR